MRIERLRLHPFGAFDDLTVDFSPNLTVVYGPNEAGKSTVVNGLLAALFGRTRWSDHFAKRLGADAFDAVVPLGGDRARVELRFVVGGKRLTATGGWGARKDTTLVLPQGAVLENENAARELRKLLPAPPNVARTILFGDQSSLAETFDRLREDRNDALVSVADFANAASRADDGVSIERFRQELDRRIDDHFRHWDEKRGKPAATRAGGRREKHLGELAKAFNRMEDARDRLERAERLEREIDEAEIDSRRAREDLATIEARLKRDEPTLKELRKRETLVSKRHLARSKRDERKNDYDAWLRAESVAEDSERDATRLREELEAATKNRTRAERFGELRARAEKYVKSQTAMEALERASAALENIPEITRASVAAVQDAVTKLERANAALEASRIQASISAKKPLALDATIDGGERTSKRLDEDEIETFEAGAKIVLRSADWTMTLSNASGDAEKTIADKRRAEEKLERALADADARSAEEAATLLEKREVAKRDLQSAERRLDDVLDGEEIEVLAEAAREAANLGSAPPLDEAIRRELDAKNRLADALRRGEEATRAIRDFRKRYETHDALLDLVARDANELSRLDKELGDAADADVSLDELERRHEDDRNRREELKSELENLRVALARMTAEAPDDDVDALRDASRLAEDGFDAARHSADALLRVKHKADELLDEEDGSKDARIKGLVERNLARLTNGKYSSAELSDLTPTALRRDEGTPLPTTLLSAGAFDALALAYRLAAAELTLEGKEGFLLLDDPFVNLDEEREELARELIREFAEKRQTIVLTCRKDRADALGGTRVDL